MPIYMDRHDVSETVTAENIAKLHQEDLRIQEQFGCRGMTYWFDEKRKTAFCLIEAPDAQAIRSMHSHAHGDIPHRVIEVETQVVESFLGRIEDPEKKGNAELNIIDDPGFRTIMVVLSSRHDPRQEVHKLLNNYDGASVRHSENYLLFSFKSVTNAVKAAVEIRKLFARFRGQGTNARKTNAGKDENIFLKIGLSAGAPVTDKKMIFQDAIKLAERMCKVVNHEIVLSSEVRELYYGENEDRLTEEEWLFSLTRADEEFLGLLMNYMESSWSDTGFRVENFCKPMGCSKSQLYRKLVALTGHSPNTFIREYRLQQALILLSKHENNISQIAFETGFGSLSYFSKCFQKRFGHLPSDYK